MKKAIFNSANFTATKFDSAADKARFANHFVRFVESGFKDTLFYDWFYKRLSMTFGHIAHYNRHGFYAEWFSDAAARARFLKHTAAGYGYGDPAWTYSDVEKALTAWVKEKKLDDYWAGRAATDLEAAERAELARLTFKYGS